MSAPDEIIHVDASALQPGVRVLIPLPRAQRAHVTVIVDGLAGLDTGALAALLQVYADLVTRGARAVRFGVLPSVAAALIDVGLAHLVAPPSPPLPPASAARAA